MPAKRFLNVDIQSHSPNLNLTAINFSTITISWNLAVDIQNCVNSYTIEVHTNNSGIDLISSVNTTNNTVYVTDLSRGVEYLFAVTGINKLGRNTKIARTNICLDGKRFIACGVNLYLYTINSSIGSIKSYSDSII